MGWGRGSDYSRTHGSGVAKSSGEVIFWSLGRRMDEYLYLI